MNLIHSPLKHSANSRICKPYRQFYDELLSNKQSENAARFLQEQLDHATQLEHDLPADMEDIADWAEQNVVATGIKYREYLSSRKAGARRRYFSNKSHALHFLKHVAPTKLVDGSWLYGALRHWKETRFQNFIRIYLEELGDGVASKNHVALYKRLLAENHCEWDELHDDLFLQGAIQLAFSHQCDDFLPELIGFNLGYEQLPLHLLITAYELNELGIDPYYFTLHITIDNLDSGHAKKALHSVETLRPHGISAKSFYQRIINGYQLNSVGKSTTDIIRAFDIEAEIVKLFQHKATIGQYMHSDRCKISGHTVNEWLSSPEKIHNFLIELEKSGWIKRYQDPTQSRFWQLLQGERSLMFGVFTPFEQQLIFDWIAGDGYTGPRVPTSAKSPTRKRAMDAMDNQSEIIDIDDYRLSQRLPTSKSLEAKMNELIDLMSPAVHATPIGLHATQLFKSFYDIHSCGF